MAATNWGCRRIAGIFCFVSATLLGLVAVLMLAASVGSDDVMAELGVLYGVGTALACLVAFVIGIILFLGGRS